MPKPVYRLESLSDDVFWMQGSAYTLCQNANINILTSFNSVRGSDLTFYVEISNFSDIPYLVQPEKFYCYYLDSIRQTTQGLFQVKARDPEKLLINVEKQINREIANYKNESLSNSLVSLLVLADNIASISSDETTEQREEREKKNAEWSEHLSESKMDHNFEMTNLSDLHYSISNEYLRKTSLQKEQMVDGKVVFPFYNNGNFVKIFFIVGDDTLTADYKIVKY